jgi:protein TonB
MSSKRLTVLGTAIAIALSAGVAAQNSLTAPGPLEKAANPITPENPIPRRIFSIAPAYPAEARALDAAANVTMRVTLDRSGRIAEVRRVNNPLVQVAPGAPSNAAALQSVGEALARSAASALSQWQYDSPANGPISFNVTFSFRPGTETASTQSAAPAAGPPPPPPPPPPPNWPAAAGAVRVGGAVKPPTRIVAVNPMYPEAAKSAGVQGVVIMEAVIGTDGRVRDARVLRSIPALDQAAVDAVTQWEYTPTLLNGAPVPVIMTVTVQFTLAQPSQPPPQ